MKCILPPESGEAFSCRVGSPKTLRLVPSQSKLKNVAEQVEVYPSDFLHARITQVDLKVVRQGEAEQLWHTRYPRSPHLILNSNLIRTPFSFHALHFFVQIRVALAFHIDILWDVGVRRSGETSICGSFTRESMKG